MTTRVFRMLSALAMSGALTTGSVLAAEPTPLPPAPKTVTPATATVTLPAHTAHTAHTTVARTSEMAPPCTRCETPMMISDGCGSDCGNALAIGGFADFIYLKARNVDMIYSRTVDGCLDNAAPRGGLGNVQPTYSPGFRIGGFIAGEECSLVGTFTWFNSQANETVRAGDNTVIQSLLTLPGTANCAANSQLATARYDVDFYFGDLDYRASLCSGCYGSLDYLIGVRYAHLDQDFRANYDILGTTTVESKIRFDGIGPRIGFAGERIGSSGLLVYSRGTANFLAGHFGADFRQTNTFVVNQGQLTYDNDRIVPILDLEVGVGWASRGGRVRVEAGYWIQGWFNTLTTPGLLRSIKANDFSTNDVLKDTLGFDGFTVRAAVKF